MGNSAFGSLLKRSRQERGLTQDDLADRVGCATQTIRKIEGGQRRPSYQMAERLSQVLRLTAEQHTAWMHAARENAAPEPVLPPEQADPPPQLRPTLPSYLTPFVGRVQEQADLARLLSLPGCRLVTLLGPGGIGKTRLAIEVARFVSFPDGVVFVPLAPVSAPLAIVPAIGNALGFSFSGTADALAELLAYLQPKRLLLVLDNLEHLLDRQGLTLGLLSQLLVQVPQVTILATARERMQLQAEWVLEIEGLVPPPIGSPMQVELAPALALFVEHAQRAQHRFQLTSANYQAAVTICHLVGGMPLAIELAAAWVDTLSCDEIARDLRRSLELLSTSSPERSMRHRSVAAVFDQTWERLDPGARLALARLSIFPGGFGREVGAYVARATVSQLATLVRHSLLRRIDDTYSLHPLVRQYAAERLRELGEQQQISERFISYFLAMAGEAAVAYGGSQQRYWTNLLNQEADNLRWTFALGFEQNHLLVVAQLCNALRRFWYMRRQGREGITWTERALAHPALPAAARPALLVTLSQLYRSINAWERAVVPAEAALTAARQSDDPMLLADALYARAALHNDLRQSDQALPLLEECLMIYQALDIQDGVLRTLLHLGNADFDLGRTAQSAARFREIVRRADALGLVQERLEGAASLGLIAVLEGDAAGIEVCREVLPEFLARNNVEVAAYCVDALGAQAGLRGLHAYASQLIGAAAELRRISGDIVSPSNQQVHTRCIELAHGSLSDVAYAAELRRGAAFVCRSADQTIDSERLLALVNANQGADMELLKR